MSTISYAAPRSSARQRASARQHGMTHRGASARPGQFTATRAGAAPVVRHLHAVPADATRGVSHPVAAAASQWEEPTRLRLTRRGRIVVVVAALIVLAVASLAFGASSVATQHGGHARGTETIVVGSGETLWDIASGIAAETGVEDVRDVMHEIEQLNNLDSGMLLAGQKLVVPATGDN